LLGNIKDLLRGFSEFDSAGFSAASRMDLSFNYYDRAVLLFKKLNRISLP